MKPLSYAYELNWDEFDYIELSSYPLYIGRVIDFTAIHYSSVDLFCVDCPLTPLIDYKWDVIMAGDMMFGGYILDDLIYGVEHV